MNRQIKELVGGIMELAYELNYSETNQEETKDKPTVFVNFSGRVCQLRVDIYPKGWSEREDNHIEYSILLTDREVKDIVTDLMEIGCELRDLLEEWS